MKRLIATLLLCTVGLSTPAFAQEPAAAAPAEAPTMLCLRDGSIQWGRILGHDALGLQFQRLDNGGQARLAWGFVDPRQELELRRRFGYIDETGDEILLDAQRIRSSEGQEFIGLIVDQSGDHFVVKTSTGSVSLPKARVTEITPTQVVATEIFSRPELYAQQLANTDPASAASQVALAAFCERVLDFAHAVEHYTKASQLDPAFRTDDVRAALARSTEKAKRQDQIDYLAEVDVLVARKRFDEAVTLAEAFAAKFPDSPLLPDAKRKAERTIKARERALTDRVAQLWFVRAAQIARDAGTKLNFEGVLSFVEGQMTQAVLDSVTKEAARTSKAATPDVVRKLWVARKKVRWQRASYGLGTWLLGQDAALKGSKGEAEKEKVAVNEKDKERTELEAKLKRFLQNQEMARKAKTTNEQKDDRELAWKELSSAARANWVLAYYAETSGDFEIRSPPTFVDCRECGGTGTRLISLAGANVSSDARGKSQNEAVIECPTCHGLGTMRKLQYR